MTLPQLLRIRWAVRATLLLGVAASVVANVLHAVDNPISQTIAAWPPFALLLTVELISRVPVHRKSLAFIRMVATAAIAGIAAWISYWHMAGVAAKYGETGASAYLLPISVDGLIVVASICLIELGGRITEAQAAKRAAAEAAALTTGEPATGPAGPAVRVAPDDIAPDRTRTRAAGPVAADHRPATSPVTQSDSGEEWFGDQGRLTDDDVPGIAALVPRPLGTAGASSQFADATHEQGYATDEYRLVDAADRRHTADRLAAGGAMAVAAGARRDRDPLTTTGSQPMLASDVAAAVEAALSGRPVARGVRGGASPRSRASISVASGSLAGRAAVPDDGTTGGLDAESAAEPAAPASGATVPSGAASGATVPGGATSRASVPGRTTSGAAVSGRTTTGAAVSGRTTTGAAVSGRAMSGGVTPGDARADETAHQLPRVPAPRTGTAATRSPARTSAAASATRQTTTGRITDRTGTDRGTGSGPDGDGAAPGGAAATTPNGTGTTRPRRSAAETAALAADIEARNPGISEAAVADELGITTRRLREVRRATDTLPA
ncbi:MULTISPECIES: DUF2637 domain-containing protein [Catenuloplanes]|uniref:DUF2637 domain-containing protein n=1 Tax=Catenuloplanes niger TaxID=587534 RepID=A0AAE3ZVX7_9ACTN|nr:hypothetical protein [Catenuloplanes niger]